MRVIYIIIFCFSSFYNIKAQLGCTDPQATNYDDTATQNDGSCVYPATNYIPEEIAEIPAPLTEASGLAFFNNQLWTHMDGGHEDKLYQIDTLTGEIIHSVIIVGADNLDWEDLTEDEEHIYIGDFGNNDGDRMDLRIFKIKKSDLSQNAVVPELIEFSYSDQTDFTPAHNANNYDCEAIIVFNDSLHLFSKNWVNFKTRHYVLPRTPGTHIAELRDSFQVQGFITAADINEEGEIVLLGYSIVGNAFMWLFFDYEGANIFSGNKRKIALGNVLNISQPEGLTFSHGREGYIASENISIFPQRLLKFSILDWVTNTVDPVFETSEAAPTFEIFPNPVLNVINVKLQNSVLGNYKISLYSKAGKKIKSWKLKATEVNQTDTLNLNKLILPKGNYYLEFSNRKTVVSKQFVKF